MYIKKLTLHSKDFNKQVRFFRDCLGFDVAYSDNSATINMGLSKLEFIKGHVDGKYHYCFLIPCNQIKEALDWLSNRLDLISVERDSYISHFESWNAYSIYFYDGEGNIAELIARLDLQNESTEEFGTHSFLSINEIGTPTSDPRSLDDHLRNTIGSPYWKGDLDRFSTNGDQQGLFLLPNYKIKKTWYPTQIEVRPLPYLATIIQDNQEFSITYENEEMNIRSKK